MRSRPYRDRKLTFRTYVPKEAVKCGEWAPRRSSKWGERGNGTRVQYPKDFGSGSLELVGNQGQWVSSAGGRTVKEWRCDTKIRDYLWVS